jgi:hypothetical protein
MTSASAADVLRFAAAESPRRNNNKRMTVHLFPFPPPLLINKGNRLL